MKEQLEIERVFLLRSLPTMPNERDRLVIEQGYFGSSDATRQGRIRLTIHRDGSCEHHANMKTGSGRVRQEREGSITPEEFARDWPSTLGRRIRKIRRCVEDGALLWEIDEFLDFQLVMAEVELPSVEHPVSVPKWLAAEVIREVSDDSRYHNYALALHGPPIETGGR